MGKKKKKQGLGQDPATILKKGEMFFQKGNYLLAKKEFEKLGTLAGQKDLLKKIEICDQEIQKQNARELLKRARKIEKGGNPGSAVKCFEEAYGVLGEDWIRKKIEQLQNVVLEIDVRQAAKDAEAACDYRNAAALYGRAFVANENKNMLLGKATCLVKGEAYAEAVSAFEQMTLVEPGHLYDFGFSLAKTGRYYECLKTWDNIPSRDEGFLEQKSLVAALLISDLWVAFEGRETPERVFKEGKYLMDAGYEYPGLSQAVEQSMFAWMGEMWKNEDYDGIRELLNRNSLEMTPALLQLYAKVCFKQTEISGTWEDLSMFWPSAVYSEDFESRFSENQKCDGVRNLLMDWAENLLQGSAQPDQETTEKIFAQWSLERAVASEIHGLVREREKVGLPILMPRLAAQMGKSAELLALVRKNRRFFKNREDYLRTGCCYSPAWESFFHLVGGEYKKAVQTLVPDESGDEFTDYARSRVLFAYGLSCIKRGTRPPDGYSDSMAILFETATRYEKQFIAEALDAVDVNVLQRFEEALMDIHNRRPSDESAKALSLIMSRRAVEMASQNLINDKVLSMQLKNALAINPENEHARGLLRDAESNLEMMALGKALSRHKMNMACKIVNESDSDVVREAFFEFFKRNIEDMDEELSSKSEKIYFLEDIYKWILKVDDDHDLLYDIEKKIDELEGEDLE